MTRFSEILLLWLIVESSSSWWQVAQRNALREPTDVDVVYARNRANRPFRRGSCRARAISAGRPAGPAVPVRCGDREGRVELYRHEPGLAGFAWGNSWRWYEDLVLTRPSQTYTARLPSPESGYVDTDQESCRRPKDFEAIAELNFFATGVRRSDHPTCIEIVNSLSTSHRRDTCRLPARPTLRPPPPPPVRATRPQPNRATDRICASRRLADKLRPRRADRHRRSGGIAFAAADETRRHTHRAARGAEQAAMSRHELVLRERSPAGCGAPSRRTIWRVPNSRLFMLRPMVCHSAPPPPAARTRAPPGRRRPADTKPERSAVDHRTASDIAIRREQQKIADSRATFRSGNCCAPPALPSRPRTTPASLRCRPGPVTRSGPRARDSRPL